MLASRSFAIVAACFLVSGFAALLYETVWLRQFAILLGTSEQALAIVLASYMGGLAIGSLVASRVVDRVRRPLLTYGLLELAIAGSALLVPVGLNIAQWVQQGIFGGLSEPPAAGTAGLMLFSISTALTLILIPTAFMGATLPLLARHVVHRDEQVGPYIGMLYAVNTVGAVFGTLTAAFFCLPALGLKQTTWVGAASNALVFALVVMLVRQARAKSAATQEPAAVDASPESLRPKTQRSNRAKRKAKANTQAAGGGSPGDEHYRWVLVLASASGAISFCSEIVFTRMLGHFLGGSIYAFGTMLSGFLLGIAIGGAIASRLASTRQKAAVAFVYWQAAAAICTLFAFAMINSMPTWPWQQVGPRSDATVQVIASILALLPPATCVGASFPLAIRIYTRDETEAAWGSARVYGWNVVGGIAGALATGIFLLPALQYHGTASAAVLGNVMISLVAVLVMRVGLVHAWAPIVAAAMLAVMLPKPPENVIRVGALNGKLTSGKMLYNHVGKSATVSVFATDGALSFQTNGLPESSVTVQGSGRGHLSNAAWLSAMPPLLRPGIESMLIVGLGGGNTAAYVPPSVRRVDVIELEPAVIAANQEIASFRVKDPLSDPRLNLIVNDGRNALALTSKRYDSIVSQPSHPWTAGASHLYTAEFAQLVRRHLNPGGVFIQWIHASFLDRTLFASMAATLRETFPHVRLYEPSEGLFLFAASDQAFTPESIVAAESGQPAAAPSAPEDRSYYEKMGTTTPSHLLAMLALDERGIDAVSTAGQTITDQRNLFAMRGPSVIGGDQLESVRGFVRQESPLNRPLDELNEFCPTLDLRVLCQRTSMRDDDLVQTSLLPKIADPAERRFLTIVSRTAAGQPVADLLQASADEFPDHPGIGFLALANSLTEKSVKLTADKQDQLYQRLPPHQQLTIDCVRLFNQQQLDAIRQRESELAMIDPDDLAGPVARLVRCAWRLETPLAERAATCREAIELIDRFEAYPRREGMDLFRTIAGINTGQPLVALGTAGDVCRRIKKQLEQDAVSVNPTILRQIRGLVSNPMFFQSVPSWYYRQTLQDVDAVLGRTGG